MFKSLFNLGYKRNFIEAIVFYIVYLILFVIILALINGVITRILYPDSTSFPEGYERGGQVANVCMPILLLISSAVLSISILVCKKLYNVGAILLTIFTICVMTIFGAILGLIPMSILTMLGNNSNSNSNSDNNNN